MTTRELVSDEFRHAAFPGFETQTGLVAEHTSFLTVIPAGADESYIMARPETASGSDPDTWFVWDADVDESQGWVPQATFTSGGLIDYGEANPTWDNGAFVSDGGEDNGEDDGDVFPSFPETPDAAPEPPEPARDPNAPVTMSIDLEDHEFAAREGLKAWESHGDFSVTVTDKGFAVVFSVAGGLATGIVRYPDRTSCQIKTPNVYQAREQAEKFLAERPYKNAYERVLGETEIGTEGDAQKTVPADPIVPASTPRPPQVKRVWSTVSIKEGEDDEP